MIIVYAAVAGQSVVKLYAAAMFPGFFLAFLYLVYIIGWAMINPKIAPPLPEEQTRVPVPEWITKFAALYSPNMFVGLFKALLSPAKAKTIEIDGKPMGYGAIAQNFLISLVPLLLTVMHARHGLVVCRDPPAGRRRERRRRRPAAARRRGRGERTVPVRKGAGHPVLYLVRDIGGRARGLDGALLSAHERRALRSAEAPDVVGDAARHPHRGGARGDPVRHHDRDGIRRRRRRRRLPARVPRPHARLEAHQGSGVPDRKDHRDGVLAVRRLGAVLGGVRHPRRPGAAGEAGCCRST